MSVLKLHDERVLARSHGSILWSARTTVELEHETRRVYIEQYGEDGQLEDQIVLPPEYIPGIIEALEKAIEKS
jgi:hypothetical protein